MMAKQCLNCGTIASRDDARFCANCATPLVSEILCPSCGTANRPEAHFCYHCATSLRGPTPQTGMLQPNAVLAGRYIIVRRVGGGGMGAVYQATDQRIQGKLWAVKEMSDTAITNLLDKQQAVDAFRREAQLLATLDHGNLPKVSDYFTEGGKHYLVMDFVQGQTLEQALHSAPGFLAEDEVVGWAVQLCDVLAYLHSRKHPVIFRDLKPANIMLDAEGRIKLIDFGIARLFQPGKGKDTQVMGTPGYAAPEQYGTGQTDARSDIYALGVTLHQLLTGYDPSLSPFNLPPARNINSRLSPAIEAVIAKATQSDVTARFQTAEEMKQVLAGRAPAPSLPRQAVSAPAATIASYTLASGLVAHSVEELVQLCDQAWDRAIDQFFDGYFEQWLQSINQFGLASAARELVRRAESGTQGERSAALAEWLEGTGYRTVKPVLKVNPSSLALGTIRRADPISPSVLHISNAGPGLLSGTVKCPVPWLQIQQPDFNCRPNETVRVEVKLVNQKLPPDRESQPQQTCTSNLVIVSSGGGLSIPVTVTLVAEPKLSVSASHMNFGRLMKSTGRSFEITNALGGILEGTVHSDSETFKVYPQSFKGNQVTITVEADVSLAPRTSSWKEYQGQVTVRSNGGSATIQVSAEIW